MARVDADGKIGGDPRWVVSDRADGANVNGWHWEEKNITAAARKLLTRCISSVTLLNRDGVALRLLAFREGKGPEGEAIALNRRRKVGVFFDFSFTIEWHGEIVDADGYNSADAHGGLSVESVDQSSIDDAVVEVELDSLRMPGTERLLKLMRSEGVVRLRGLLQRFYDLLRAEHDPRAADERRREQAEAEQQRREAEAAEDRERLRQDAEVAAQKAATVQPSPPPRDAGGDTDEMSSAARKEAEAAAIQRREAEKALRRRDEERRRQQEDDSSRRRLEAERERRRQEQEQARMARAARCTPESKSRKTDEELLDFITGD
eukprot:TRINITY_DN30492_c0_g1_i1.p1 TRINITY_DN30492_c0_g1~~TRINITY_DN30492_c0_g1_i1.p1  ORF type:complete len:338 (+),score=140.90 TRINITY_DN30492_c0_g1_i1:57-1016(+)